MSIHGLEFRTPAEIVGMSFKRTKYGLTDWTDIIDDVRIILEYSVHFKEYRPTCYVYGKNGNSYKMDEIVILNVRDEIDLSFLKNVRTR